MRKCFLSLVFILSLLFVRGQYSAKNMSSGGALHPLQANMDIRHYTLALHVEPDSQTIRGYCSIEMRLEKPADTILIDLAPFYTITSLTVNDNRSEYHVKSDRIFIVRPGGFNSGKNIVRVDYHGKPPIAEHPPWEGGFTWKKDKSGNPWIVINCQMQGGKIYFPCKDHPSDEPNDGVDLYITVPKGLSVAGPGMLAAVKRATPETSTWHWKTLYPISNYCVLFNIGKYKVYKRNYTTIEGNTVPMEYYILEEDTAHAKQVLDMRARDTRILEKYFGEYPWVKEKIGIAEVPNPGMEHQTMITYANDFKVDTINGQLYSANLYHEFGHEWWANKVTNRDWAHMWIQEGINTYAESLFFLEMGGERAYDSSIGLNKKYIDNETPIVPGEVADTRAVYNGDIYSKGAYFMHSLRFMLGDSVFFPALKKLATDPAFTYNNNIITDDVEKHFSKAAQKNLKPFFDQFLRTTNLFEFTITKLSANQYQIEAVNIPMEIPLEISTSNGIQKINCTAGKFSIASNDFPVIDPRAWYLKKVRSEK
ncbi:M1 family metallopeptidase [Pollutibacter soli]|uniref:M1 family metallopeptidase n=1 Tax=Pollutibacter soli TaxID=3034157 RepID=UPI0030133816